MEKSLIKAFWNCGDNQIIEFAILRAHLNKEEKQVLFLILDECLSQESTAEQLDYSVRKVQDVWRTGINKLLSIPWVMAYAKELESH